jgi:hypothetical protein
VFRDGPLAVAPALAGDRDLAVERVTDPSAAEWAEFMERACRIDTALAPTG